ncbi:25661_t:CDS:1, partial [Dentiscutata erythropus]
ANPRNSSAPTSLFAFRMFTLKKKWFINMLRIETYKRIKNDTKTLHQNLASFREYLS